MTFLKNLYLSFLVLLGTRSPHCKAPYELTTYEDGRPAWGKERCSNCKGETRKEFSTS